MTATGTAPLEVEVTRWTPAVADVWGGLDARWRPGLSCSLDWTETWLGHYGDLLAHEVVVGRRDGEPCGAALLVRGAGQRHGPVPVRTLHLGCTGEPRWESVFTPYNRLLVRPGDRAAFADELVATARRRGGWDELRLQGLALDDAVALARAAPELIATTEPCPTRDLTAAAGCGGALLALTQKVRYQVRRAIRAVGGEVTGRLAQTPAEVDAFLDELVALHQEAWEVKGERGAFASPRFRGFHRELAHRLAERDTLVLFRSEAGGGRTVGCLLGFVEHGRVLMYQGGFAAFDDPRAKPGFITHVLCMEAAIARGLAEYDLLAGDSEYKRDLTDTARRTVSLTERRGARTAAIEGLRRARRWAARH
jgi:CelD/BcsL family acetyltransferase involved in cellulose biosynthesis